MKKMHHYATVSKALTELAKKGFTTDFNLHEEQIKNNLDEFKIEEIYRYEGETDPADEATVYGIKSSSGEKGVYVAGYGAYMEGSTALALRNLTMYDPDKDK